MALKKQSIRKNQHITSEGITIPKEELILRSESWSEPQINFFKKMIKQGGEFKVAGVKYNVTLDERNDVDSKGERPKTVAKIPGERTF
jgi:hypothetical protein|tara:strand:- start:2995 stop:3258 length:264 start_codon:yes stop_codon:yes gene_type:complete